jgi:hypothetical protein
MRPYRTGKLKMVAGVAQSGVQSACSDLQEISAEGRRPQAVSSLVPDDAIQTRVSKEHQHDSSARLHGCPGTISTVAFAIAPGDGSVLPFPPEPMAGVAKQ